MQAKLGQKLNDVLQYEAIRLGQSLDERGEYARARVQVSIVLDGGDKVSVGFVRENAVREST